MSTTGQDLFVGRQRELAALSSAVADALSGKGRLVLVGGDPGIGKTRLADEVSRTAEREHGALVLSGRCWEAGGAPANWPWTQVLRKLVHAAESTSLASQLEDGRSYVARLVPDLRGTALGHEDAAHPPGIGDSARDRFRLDRKS